MDILNKITKEKDEFFKIHQQFPNSLIIGIIEYYEFTNYIYSYVSVKSTILNTKYIWGMNVVKIGSENYLRAAIL